MNSRLIVVLSLAAALLSGAQAQDIASDGSPANASISNNGGRSDQVLSGTVDEQFDQVVVVRSRGRSRHSDPNALSPDFTTAALAAAFQMESTERRLEQSIKRGFPLGEFWIQNDLDQVDDGLKLAALNVKNSADAEALERLESQSSRLREWADWLVQANRKLQLAEYYISPSTLDNDERFQSSVECTNFLVSMLTTRKLADDRSCY